MWKSYVCDVVEMDILFEFVIIKCVLVSGYFFLVVVDISMFGGYYLLVLIILRRKDVL